MTPEADLMEKMQETPTIKQEAEFQEWRLAHIPCTDNHLVRVTSIGFSCLGEVNTGEKCRYGDNGILQIILLKEQESGLDRLGLKDGGLFDSDFYRWTVSITPLNDDLCVRISPELLLGYTKQELRAKRELAEHNLTIETMAIATTMELQQAFPNLQIEPVNYRESAQIKDNKKKGK